MIGGIKALAATGIGTALIAFPAGWKAKSTLIDAAHGRAMDEAQVQHKAALAALQVELDSAAVETIRLSAELNAAQTNTRIVTREIIKQVPQSLEGRDEDCVAPLPTAMISLHNRAASGL